MQTLAMPSIDNHYTVKGEDLTVIGSGTNGIVVEYHDGRVELIPKESWNVMFVKQNTLNS